MASPEHRLDPPPPAPPTAWPELVVRALEVANWRAVLYEYQAQFAAAAQEEGAFLLVIAVAIAQAMRWQTLGQLPLAWCEIESAARMLPRAMCPQGATRPAFVELVPQPTAEQGLSRWTWRMARVAWREQQEMLELKVRLRYAEPPEVLVAALVERLRGVDKDPWTWGPIVHDDGIEFLATRKDLLDRATDLGRFATPTMRAVTPSVWRRGGAYRGAYADALRWLAAADLVPWVSANPLARNIPVRCGRRYARREAKLWVRTTNP